MSDAHARILWHSNDEAGRGEEALHQFLIDVVADDTKKRAVLAGSIIALLVLFIVYVLGRRTGKRKSTVVEIRRF